MKVYVVLSENKSGVVSIDGVYSSYEKAQEAIDNNLPLRHPMIIEDEVQ
jgi:hypothetical protein